jgi:hypothetical protein
LIEKSHLSFQMSSFPLNFVGTHAHWIEKWWTASLNIYNPRFEK